MVFRSIRHRDIRLITYLAFVFLTRSWYLLTRSTTELSISCFFCQGAFCSSMFTRSSRSISSLEFASLIWLNPADLETGRFERCRSALPADRGGGGLCLAGSAHSLANFYMSFAPNSLLNAVSHFSTPTLATIACRACLELARTSSFPSVVSRYMLRHRAGRSR